MKIEGMYTSCGLNSMLFRPMASMDPHDAPPGIPIPRTASEPSTMMTAPTARNPIENKAGAMFGRMCFLIMVKFFVPMDFDARTNSLFDH